MPDDRTEKTTLPDLARFNVARTGRAKLSLPGVRALASLPDVARSVEALRRRVLELDEQLDRGYEALAALEQEREALLEILDTAEQEHFGEVNEDLEVEAES